MSQPVTRRSRPRPGLCLSAEFIKEKFKELEARVDRLQSMLADRTYRLASRVSLLERGCAYAQAWDGS